MELEFVWRWLRFRVCAQRITVSPHLP